MKKASKITDDNFDDLVYKVRVDTWSGCDGCVLSKGEYRCSTVPCQPHMSRPYPVIYKLKENRQ